ncbi:MAG: hypothetical protein AVDCRST_MAG27-389, partial [uncultured Craurococcus sp.]
ADRPSCLAGRSDPAGAAAAPRTAQCLPAPPRPAEPAV